MRAQLPAVHTSAVMEAPLSTRPIRRVLQWQAVATVAMAGVAGLMAGGHGALSAVLGGVVNITAVVVYAVVMGISMRGVSARGIANPASPGGTMTALFRAEACKILVIILQLCLVLVTYKDLVPAAFFTSFVVTVLLFRIALLERN